MSVDPEHEKQLVLAASALATPQERDAYLDRECQGDAELRARVEALLAANADAAGWPDVSISPGVSLDLTTATGTPSPDLAGLVLAGKYKLIERIGEGGMGSVWLASQSEPVKRMVAVKLIKLGMDSRQVIKRFEAERQALAMMDHPNIARVLDGGISPDGRPFFVMELVKGTPITKFCDARRLSLKERLDLFVPVCQAIQHAHQKGIIHRDIKPGNVLIALYDDRPVPKVIDFGIAKATGQQLTDVSLHTGFGGVVGTPQYMSPEQATLNNLDIDTRSDVYSLGILLYELLAGSPPFAKQELEKRGLMEILRVVREEEPPKPSTRLSSADTLPSLSANRSIEPRKLTAMLRSELDWVVLKAIEKNRARRYDTANGFAADIQRYLAGEPVIAHPPSAAYRMRKLVHRNRPQVVAVSLILFALLSGLAGTTYELRRADHFIDAEKLARAELERRQVEVALQRNRAETEENLAKDRLSENDDFSGLLGEVFQGPDPDRGTITVAGLLDLTAAQLDTHFLKQPEQKARLQAALGGFNYKLGRLHEAVSLREKVRDYRLSTAGPDDPQTLDAMSRLASSYHALHRKKQATTLWDQVLSRSITKFGEEDPRTVAAMNNLAFGYDNEHPEKSIPLLERAVVLQKKIAGPDAPVTLTAQDNLANFYGKCERFGEAIPIEERVVAMEKQTLPPNDPATLRAMNNLAFLYAGVHNRAKALDLRTQVLKLRTLELGPDHSDTLDAMGNLALSYADAGRDKDAIQLWKDTLAISQRVNRPDSPETLQAMRNLAKGYFDLGQAAEALALRRQALDICQKQKDPDEAVMIELMVSIAATLFPTDHSEAISMQEKAVNLLETFAGFDSNWTISAMSGLGHYYSEAKRADEAITLEKQVISLSTTLNGPDGRETLTAMNNLAHSYFLQQQYQAASALQVQVLSLSQKSLGLDDSDTLRDMNNLAATYSQIHRLSEAISLGEKIVELSRAVSAPEKAFRLSAIGNLAMYCFNNGDYARASVLLREELAMQPARPLTDAERAKKLAFLGYSLLKSRDFVEAEKVLRECSGIREKISPTDWKTFSTQSQLGEALLGQKNYRDAEPLLLDGYRQMKKSEANIPSESRIRLFEAAERLIAFYAATNQPEELAHWKAKYNADLRPATQPAK